VERVDFSLGYTPAQKLVFWDIPCKLKLIPKGRRLGFTHGLAHYAIERALEKPLQILWVDTINGNIDRYVERYFLPALKGDANNKGLPKRMWKWRQQKKELKIGGTVIDFRSADSPENIEGFGYHLILLNEAGIILKKPYLWYNAILPMAMDFGADIVVGGTPKGKKYKGEEHLYYTLVKDSMDYKDFKKLSKKAQKEVPSVNIELSTHHNPLLKKKELDRFIASVPACVRDQEIFGKFTDSDEIKVFQKEWWKYWGMLPPTGHIIQSWDTAFKKGEENDYSVCTTWLNSKLGFYLLDVVREKLEFPQLVAKVKSLNAKYKPNIVLIEDKASGQSLLQTLRQETKIPLKAIKPNSDKISRANAVTPMVESGRVFFPLDTPKWMKDFLDELEEFPNVEHDDQVDSVTQALTYMKNNAISPKISTPKKGKEQKKKNNEPEKPIKRRRKKKTLTDGF